MNRSSLAIRNSSIGLISQIIAVIFQLITRKVFVQYLGVELLGISSTFSSVLNTLSLAELGFQTAIIYNLYKPLATNDEEQINNTVNVLKIIYRCIGVFFIVAGVVCLPLLKYILSGIEISGVVYAIFLIQVANSAFSYFLAYKRTLLFADRREFITKIVDTVLNVVINLIKIYVVIKTSNYIIYISLTLTQTILSNLIIHMIAKKIYPFLHKTKWDYELFKKIWDNVKNLFVGKLAFYVYSSTDNIVVSALVSTVSVGFMVNYTTIISNLRTLANSIFSPITPIIGNMVAEQGDQKNDEYVCRLYSFVRYVIACMIIIPVIVLIQDFISVWVGKEFLLSDLIVWLYCLDLYIFFVHGPLCDFISVNGLFKEDRNIEIIGAACNLVSSVILAKIFGITGVLIGTVFSQIVFWIGRSLIAYRKCFQSEKKIFVSYWIRNLKYMVCFVFMCVMLTKIYQWLPLNTFIVRFICGGVLCEVSIMMGLVLLFRKTDEFKSVSNIFKRKLGIKK